MTFSLALGQDVSDLNTILADFPQRNPTRSAPSLPAWPLFLKDMCSMQAEGESTVLAIIMRCLGHLQFVYVCWLTTDSKPYLQLTTQANIGPTANVCQHSPTMVPHTYAKNPSWAGARLSGVSLYIKLKIARRFQSKLPVRKG